MALPCLLRPPPAPAPRLPYRTLSCCAVLPPAGGHSVGSEVGGVPQEGFTFYLRPDDGSPMSINSLDVRFFFFFSFFLSVRCGVPRRCVGCLDAGE